MASSAAGAESGRNRLTKEFVVGRALALADATGLDTLSIRKLAQELGVTPMALYWHFRSKEELLDGLAERVWSEIDVTADASAPWPARLRVMMESLVRVLRAHPSAPHLLLNHRKQSQPAMRVTEAALEVLRGAGFDPVAASEITSLGLMTAISLVMMSEPDVWQTPDERAEEMRKKQVVFATLPVAAFPRLVECAAALTAHENPDFHYDFGISLFIAGVEAMAA